MSAYSSDQDRRYALEHLTIRQKQILRLIADGHQAKEIARLIGIGERTVKTHTEAARKRLGVATSREAARWLAAAEKSSTDVGPDDRWPSGPMAEAQNFGADLPSVQQTEHAAMGDGVFADGVESFSGADVVRGPALSRAALFFSRMRVWLKGLNALSWMGLIVAVALGATVLVSGLIFTIVGCLEALRHLISYLR
ncbi:MAG: helix-turn-helix transcriptional regulator [Asticcacaulis sp.]